MKRVLSVIFMVFLFLAILSAASARRTEAAMSWWPWLQKLKIIGIIDSGGIKDYKAIHGGRIGILKTSERHEVGDVLHSYFSREEVDEYGLPVWKPSFQVKRAGDFHGGWAFISVYPNSQNPYFYSINIDGKSFTPLNIFPIEFSEETAFDVNSKGSVVRIINTKGELLFDEAFTERLSLSVWSEEMKRVREGSKIQMRFSDGLAPVYVKNKSGDGGTFYIMNKSGDLKPITTQDGQEVGSTITDIQSFSEGMARFEFEATSTGPLRFIEIYSGYLDSEGRVVKTKFDGERAKSAGSFHDGLAIVNTSGKRIAVDKTGNTVLDLTKYKSAYLSFSDGLLGVQEKSGSENWAYIDTKGKQVTNYNFREAYPFSEGLAAVTRGNSDWGYINKKGEPVIKFQFSQAGSFSEGLAAVKEKSGGGWKYIDKTGEIVIEPKGKTTFSEAGYFSEGYAKVKTSDGKWAYIDTNGDIKLWFR